MRCIHTLTRWCAGCTNTGWQETRLSKGHRDATMQTYVGLKKKEQSEVVTSGDWFLGSFRTSHEDERIDDELAEYSSAKRRISKRPLSTIVDLLGIWNWKVTISRNQNSLGSRPGTPNFHTELSNLPAVFEWWLKTNNRWNTIFFTG